MFFKKKLPKKLIINEIVLSGVLYGLYIAIRFAFKELNIINGYSPQIHMIILALGLFCLRTYSFRIIFLFISPFFSLIGGSSPGVGIIFDYLIPHWAFFPFIFLNTIFEKLWINKKKIMRVLVYGILIGFNIFSYLTMGFSYTISGIIAYNKPFIYSASVNFPIAGISLAISCLIMCLTIYPIHLLNNKVSKHIYY